MSAPADAAELGAGHQVELLDGGFSYLVTHKQLGEVLDLGHSMIAKLRDEGMPQVRYGVYDLRQCVPWYVDKWRRARGDGGAEETSTRSALNIAQRERIELEIARTKGELVERELVRKTLAALGATIAAAFSGFPARNAPQLAALAEPDQVRAFLRTECRAVLVQLAEQVRALGAELRDDFEAAAAAPAPEPAPRKRATRRRAQP